MSFFGGQNATKIKDTGAPKYELPYIAKSYLTQSNQLFVTRVLGFSGYDAGLGWGITLDAALDESTVVTGSTRTYATGLITYSATSGNTNLTLTSSDPLMTILIADGALTDTLAAISAGATGSTIDIPATYHKNGTTFTGLSTTLKVVAKGTTNGGANITGTTSGITTYYTGSGYSEVENTLVALLRSRGGINVNTQLPAFELTASTNIAFDSSLTAALTDPLADFALTGTSNVQGVFNYSLSLDKTKKNYLPRVLGRTAQDGTTAAFSEEFFDKMFENFNADGKIRGIRQTLVQYGDDFKEYRFEYSPAVTPYVVSELRGNNILKLFRFWTISDGNAANEQFKISIRNIKLDTKEFDVVVRAYYDTDAQPTVLESFSKVTMDPTSNNYIARRIGTLDGEYPSKSTYVLIEMDNTTDTSDAFPAGFVGFPVRNYQTNSNSTVKTPLLTYKTSYSAFENKRKYYLGLSNTVGIDSDFFDYKGAQDENGTPWTALTKGFHMDVDATGATIENFAFLFDTGNAEFRTESGVMNTDYEKLYARKFTFAPYGGFDGWDIYRTRRSNLDSFLINGTLGSKGLTSHAFANKTLSNGDLGITSDYYAYLEAIWTFKNPEAVNINVFATPGIDNIDNSNLIEATIEMVEQDRADSLYIMTTPDTSGDGTTLLSAEDVVDTLDGMYDSNYSCTYWPWIQVNDTENNVYIWMPATRDVVRNIALTDNVAFPWFAVAGIQRGDVDAIQARKKLTLSERDTLYEGRVNPIATFTSDGIKIWGNKTLQVKDTALNRINVRRLLLQARKLISAVSIRLLFEQNDAVVRNQFLALVNPILDNIRAQRGLVDFRVVLSNDPEDIDRNQLTGQIFLKPTRALEFIQLEFVIMNTGASFDNI
jgi:hypothetical protein